jgi:protein tyrosine phosphatase (PTP) superfamily phosphohydrolase (DUF442 family)
MERLKQREGVRGMSFLHLQHEVAENWVHAIEDLPPEVRDVARDLKNAVDLARDRPVEDTSFHKTVADELENAAKGVSGELEHVHFLRFIAHYPATPYVSRVSPAVLRGSRPTVATLRTLLAEGVRTTVNLCREIEHGDAPLVGTHELAGMRAVHIGVTDGTPPDLEQVETFLKSATDPQQVPLFVHCEAGKGRTGVMVACYRVLVQGWALEDAKTEASHFGCSTPDQSRFVEDVAARVQEGDEDLTGFAEAPYGTVEPTPEQLAATVP